MLIPKVIFKYSWIYDQKFKKCVKTRNYPSTKKIMNYIKKLEKIWSKIDKEILRELSKASRLKWKSKFIYCYVVGKCVPFSDPLTLPVYKNLDCFIDALIHELIHQLFVQNSEETKRSWRYIYKKYSNESFTTQIHIPLHAFHSHIYLKFFDEERLKQDIKRVKKLKDYRKSWEIVEREGYGKIINEFVKRVRL